MPYLRSLTRSMLGAAPVVWMAVGAPAHAVCGDAVLDGTETCDDGGTTAGDGCDATCVLEAGWSCLQTELAPDFNEMLDSGTAASWSLSGDGYTLEQSVNSGPTVYVSTLPADVATLTLELAVDTEDDDDFIGFVVGYSAGDATNPSADWILFDWKQDTQYIRSDYSYVGLAMSRVTGATAENDLWHHAGSVSEIARGAVSGSVGWDDETTYTIELSYSTTQVQVWVDGVLEFDETGTFPEGQVGFYGLSQSDLVYSLVAPRGLTVWEALDSDGDGLTDPDELNIWGTDPNLADTDADGIDDRDEVDVWGTNPLVGDSDGDGLSDGDEVAVWGTNPLVGDSDGDGLSDGDEVDVWGSNPWSGDSDGDGLGDWDEVEVHGTDPARADSDEDGLSDPDELSVYFTNPTHADSDEDGLSDGDEVRVYETNPNEADSDDDGLSDGDEVRVYETNPNEADSDDDGLSDGDEVWVYETNPNEADSDDDGLSDGDEVRVYLTNPNDADSDGDDLSDGDEVRVYLTNPNDADTDGGGTPDGAEIAGGTNPLDPSDDPADRDQDGLTDWAEENTWGTDPDRADTDGDGVSDGDEVAAGTDPTVAPEPDPEPDAATPDAKGGYTGGSCSAAPSGGGLWAVLLGLGVVGRRRARR